MKPFKNLMGNGAKEQEQLAAMRAVLADIQRERERFETLVEGSKAGAERLKQLGEPLAKTEGEMHTLESRMSQMQERFQAMVKLADLFNNLDERAEGLTKSTQWAESRLSTALEGSQKIESTMADLVSKVDLAADLKERFEKSGVAVYGPVATNNVFKGFGGACEARNNGDAVVRYDQLADRWLMVMPIFARSPDSSTHSCSFVYLRPAGYATSLSLLNRAAESHARL